MTRPLIFISHITEEEGLAIVLKTAILQAFDNRVEVFVSSDKQSILAGKEWLNQIIESLEKSLVVLVLVSHISQHRPWINFEAGVGRGHGASVIPISIRDFSLGKLAFPLAGLQGRSIEDLSSILADISNRIELENEKQDLELFKANLEEAESTMAYKGVDITPFIKDNILRFEISNTGSIDLELLMFEVWIPSSVVASNWVWSSDLVHIEHTKITDYQYVWLASTSQRGAFGGPVPCLRPVITAGMGIVALPEMQIPLQTNRTFKDEQWLIQFRLHASNFPTSLERKKLIDIENRT